MFAPHRKFQSMFKTQIDFVSTEKKDDLPPPDLPIPETKKQQKEQQKYRYLPGERLSIQLAKQAKKTKKESKKDKLNAGDIERLSASMGRIMKIVA